MTHRLVSSAKLQPVQSAMGSRPKMYLLLSQSQDLRWRMRCRKLKQLQVGVNKSTLIALCGHLCIPKTTDKKNRGDTIEFSARRPYCASAKVEWRAQGGSRNRQNEADVCRGRGEFKAENRLACPLPDLRRVESVTLGSHRLCSVGRVGTNGYGVT